MRGAVGSVFFLPESGLSLTEDYPSHPPQLIPCIHFFLCVILLHKSNTIRDVSNAKKLPGRNTDMRNRRALLSNVGIAQNPADERDCLLQALSLIQADSLIGSEDVVVITPNFTVCARLLGFRPQAIQYLYDAISCGVGEGDLEKMQISGLNIRDAEKAFSHAVYGEAFALDE